MKKQIGNYSHKINVSSAYLKLAKSDEISASILAKNKEYRQACYLIIQSMEKYIRYKIFTLVNPNNEYFRNRNRNHSLEDAIDFLVEIISTNDIVKSQVTKQIKEYVLGNTKYNFLHNNLRYPNYSKKFNSYSILEINENDFYCLEKRLCSLKVFIKDIHNIKS